MIVGRINNIMWLYLYQFGMLNLVPLPSWHLTTTLRPISSAQRSSILSLLEKKYPHRQIHDKTGIEMGTISRIGREVNFNKENNSGGRPAKLSTCVTSSLFSAKSPLTSLTMLFRLPISSIPHSPNLFIPRLFEMHWKRLVYTLQQRRIYPCLS